MSVQTQHDRLDELLGLVVRSIPEAKRETVKGHDNREYVVIATNHPDHLILLSANNTGEIICTDFFRGWYDRDGWGEPDLTTVFVAKKGNPPKLTHFNMEYALDEHYLPLLHALDQAWGGAISKSIAGRAKKILAHWIPTNV